MANTLLNPSLVTYEVARRFSNNLKGVGQFNRQYSDEFAKKGAKVGDTIKIRLAPQFEVSSGEALVEQNLVDRTANLILNRRRHIGMGWSTAEEALDLDDLRNRYTDRAGDTLASIYDQLALADVYKAVYQAVGTPGSNITAALTYSLARTKLADMAGPLKDVVALLTPYSQAVIADSVKGYNGPESVVREAWVEGMFAMGQLGIDKWLMDQNVPRFTTGSAAGSPLVNGAGQTGTSLVTDGWTSGQLAGKKGDIITIGGVFSVNPLSKESTGQLQQFVLTVDITDTTGAATLSLSPAIVTTGAYQNVTAAPADNAVITFWSMAAAGTMAATVSAQNLIFHRDAFYSGMADLAKPRGGAEYGMVSSKDLNISIRLVEQYDINDDRNKSRLDFLAGFAAGNPELAVRAAAAA
jgi:hypothetical protein